VPRVFIAYPHGPGGRELLAAVAVPAILQAGAECVVAPADMVGPVLDAVAREIAACDAVVAVVIGRNRHVFLEIGLARGLGKPCIVLAPSQEDLGMLADALPVVAVAGDGEAARQALIEGVRLIATPGAPPAPLTLPRRTTGRHGRRRRARAP
jgi:hypothetical protein